MVRHSDLIQGKSPARKIPRQLTSNRRMPITPNRVARIPLWRPIVNPPFKVPSRKKLRFCIQPAGQAASALIGIAM